MDKMNFRGLAISIVAASAALSTVDMATAQVIHQAGAASAVLSPKQARVALLARLELTDTFFKKRAAYAKMGSAWPGHGIAGQLVNELSEDQVNRALATTTPAELETVLYGSQAARDLLSDLVNKHTSAAGIQKALGDAAADLVFTPLIPCRIMDTRGTAWSAPAPLAAGVTLGFEVTGTTAIAAQGGVQSGGCGVPVVARAVSVNITVLSPASGWLYFWPPGSAQPNASIINWNGPSTGYIANAAVLSVLPALPAAYIQTPVAGTQVIMDVLGYFAPPFATALVCTTQTATINFAASNSTVDVTTPACPAGSTLTGGGMDSNFTANNFMYYTSAPSGASWHCRGRNVDLPSAWTGTCYATCCKTPGL